MWEAIGGALKVFVEKHLIPTVISVVTAIITFLALPEDHWMIIKLGTAWFIILIAGIAFLAVQLLVGIWKGIQHLRYRAYISNEGERLKTKEVEEGLEKWLSFMDKLPPDDRELIITLIKSGNTPIKQVGYRSYNYDSVYNTNLLVKIKNKDGSTQIKLDDRAFQVLKAIYDERGSITHF